MHISLRQQKNDTAAMQPFGKGYFTRFTSYIPAAATPQAPNSAMTLNFAVKAMPQQARATQQPR
ncbi:MAG: hypothetical protein BCS36_09100 [Desulfovibrio sp. MES5]|nr:MAG: hypothetical protein BCS36_09100 [Desulfovibrio sp. MES5]